MSETTTNEISDDSSHLLGINEIPNSFPTYAHVYTQTPTYAHVYTQTNNDGLLEATSSRSSNDNDNVLNEETPSRSSSSNDNTEKKYKHRNKRVFTSDPEKRKERDKLLNKEASKIYRRKKNEYLENLVLQLREEQERNEQLTSKHQKLKQECNDIKTQIKTQLKHN